MTWYGWLSIAGLLVALYKMNRAAYLCGHAKGRLVELLRGCR